MFAKVLGSLRSVLLVPNWSNAIWVLFSKSILLARHRTCCTLSPPTPRLIFFRKYFLHTCRYLLWHAAIKFPIIIIDGPFFCSNPSWSLCTLNHPGVAWCCEYRYCSSRFFTKSCLKSASRRLLLHVFLL